MIVLLFGGNELAMRRRLQELKDEADGGSGMLMTNLATIDGRDATLADVLAPCMAPPFLAPRRLVIVEHLLERFEPRGGPRGSRNLGPWEQLPEALKAGMPETTILVFFGQPFLAEARDRVVTKSNPLVTRIAEVPGAIVEEFPAIKGKDLERYIREEAAARGLRFRAGQAPAESYEASESRPPETDPATLLANLLQGDTLSIASELDKLALYTMGTNREVTVAEVNRVCAGDRQAKSWDLTDAVINGNLAAALGALELLKTEGVPLPALLGLIVSRYRGLAPVIEVVAAGAPALAIAAELKRPNDWRLERDVRVARRLGTGGLRRAYEYLVEADRTNKQGEVDEGLAMEVLLMKLCAMTPAAAGRR